MNEIRISYFVLRKLVAFLIKERQKDRRDRKTGNFYKRALTLSRARFGGAQSALMRLCDFEDNRVPYSLLFVSM